MKPKIVLTFVYLLLIILLAVLIVQKYEASVTGRFYFVGAHDKATFNPECRNIKIIASDKYNQPLFFKDKTVYVNLKLVDKLKMPKKIGKNYNPNNPPLLYQYKSNQKNILIIGDSYTQGADVSYNESYPYYLSKMLKYNIVNLGIGGYNTKMEIKRFFIKQTIYKPTLIVWQLCGNDMEDMNEYWSLAFNIFKLLKTKGYNCTYPLDESNLILKQAGNIYYKKIFPNMERKLMDENVIKPLLKFENYLKKTHVPVILVLLPDTNNLYNKFPKYFHDNITVIDMKKEIPFPGWKPPFTVSKTKIHFSPRTNKELAEVLAQKIKEVLK